MNTRRNNRSLTFFGAIGAVLALLIVLAGLQYYWVGQVSLGERDRMQTNLEVGAARFAEDFDREITRIFLSFQAPIDRSSLASAFAQRYAAWRTSTLYPELIEAIYITSEADDGTVTLQHFDLAQHTIEPLAWPVELSSLRDAIEAEQRTLWAMRARRAAGAGVPPGQISFLAAPPLPVSDLPVVIIPQPMLLEAADHATPELRYTIVMLDRAYLFDTFIPLLARRYFAGPNGLDYHLEIVPSNNPEQVIYSSGQPIDPPTSGDAQIGLFGVQLDRFNTIIIRTAPGEAPIDGTSAWRFDLESATLASKLPTPTARTTPVAAARVPGAATQSQWTLVLRHRAGSVDAAIASLRQRNLVISFGILLLLGASVGLVLAAARRSQHLARQQVEFVAAVTHELRTPLAVIRSAAENLADGIVRDPEQARRYGQLIHTEGRRLSEMVEQVLEFAGAQAGRRTYTMEPVAPAAVVAHAIAAARPLLAEAGARVEQMIAPDLPLLLGDPQALQRAVQNLISNAAKYGGKAGPIVVRVEAGPGAHSPEVRIVVADQGIGIAPEDLPHIFEPFYRGKQATAAQVHGNGLGLSLVQQIVQAHGGRVSVVSSAGQGSTLTLHLPVRHATQPLVEAAPGPADEVNHEPAHPVDRR